MSDDWDSILKGSGGGGVGAIGIVGGATVVLPEMKFDPEKTGGGPEVGVVLAGPNGEILVLPDMPEGNGDDDGGDYEFEDDPSGDGNRDDDGSDDDGTDDSGDDSGFEIEGDGGGIEGDGGGIEDYGGDDSYDYDGSDDSNTNTDDTDGFFQAAWLDQIFNYWPAFNPHSFCSHLL